MKSNNYPSQQLLRRPDGGAVGQKGSSSSQRYLDELRVREDDDDMPYYMK